MKIVVIQFVSVFLVKITYIYANIAHVFYGFTVYLCSLMTFNPRLYDCDE